MSFEKLETARPQASDMEGFGGLAAYLLDMPLPYPAKADHEYYAIKQQQKSPRTIAQRRSLMIAQTATQT